MYRLSVLRARYGTILRIREFMSPPIPRADLIHREKLNHAANDLWVREYTRDYVDVYNRVHGTTSIHEVDPAQPNALRMILAEINALITQIPRYEASRTLWMLEEHRLITLGVRVMSHIACRVIYPDRPIPTQLPAFLDFTRILEDVPRHTFNQEPHIYNLARVFHAWIQLRRSIFPPTTPTDENYYQSLQRWVPVELPSEQPADYRYDRTWQEFRWRHVRNLWGEDGQPQPDTGSAMRLEWLMERAAARGELPRVRRVNNYRTPFQRLAERDGILLEIPLESVLEDDRTCTICENRYITINNPTDSVNRDRNRHTATRLPCRHVYCYRCCWIWVCFKGQCPVRCNIDINPAPN